MVGCCCWRQEAFSHDIATVSVPGCFLLPTMVGLSRVVSFTVYGTPYSRLISLQYRGVDVLTRLKGNLLRFLSKIAALLGHDPDYLEIPRI